MHCREELLSEQHCCRLHLSPGRHSGVHNMYTARHARACCEEAGVCLQQRLQSLQGCM